MKFEHIPVMADVIAQVAKSTPADGIIIDATLGGGGHSKLLLETISDKKLIAFDRDVNAINAASTALKEHDGRFEIIHSGFMSIGKEIQKRKLKGEVSIVLFDLGVSSHQLDVKERGFTYRHEDAPLDMRMDSSQELTAEKIVNEYSSEELERIIRENSDEKFARQIAQRIVENRPFYTAGELVATIREAIPHRFQRITHPAKRTFQALRMEVNKELEQLQIALDESVHLLAPGGRILVLSYHSGEDKIVKDTFKKYVVKAPQTNDGRLLPSDNIDTANKEISLKKVSAPKKPSKQEVDSNPRSKSARLRVVERVDPEYPKASGL